MPFILARRGRCVFRQLNLRETLPLSVRVSLVPNHVRRVVQIASSRPSQLTTAAGLPKGIFTRTWANSYATTTKAKKTTAKAKANATKAKKAKKSSSSKKKAPRGRRPNKELSASAKERKERRERAAEIRRLKEIALKEPKPLPVTAFTLYIQEKMKGKTGQIGKDEFRAVISDFKSLSADQLEPYQRQAEENKAANAAAYESWVKSYTPLQIRQANFARRKLAKLTESYKYHIKMNPIKDDRQVKMPKTPYNSYCKERFQSGDLKHMSITDAARRITEEWKGMTEQEKEKYKRLYQQDVERYVREYREVYGEEPSYAKDSRTEAAA
ncbi:hypothetical protein VTN77DRAFT_1372 [Rasamsonia byssochlamydoides]|uniref:uncharacterized protein n=1 Tax=Rasamsonia byssochlamydoides TaxID=89139 RepID=UPI0037429D7D